MSILYDRGVVPPVKALLHVHIFVSGGRQLCSLLYSVRQLHHFCRMDAEEDVQDFRQLRPGLDSPQVTFFASTLKNLLCIFRQYISLVPSLNALSRFQHINWSTILHLHVCMQHPRQSEPTKMMALSHHYLLME